MPATSSCSDNEKGKTFPATIEVNKPLIYRGMAVYQSSFGDGGSKLTSTGFPMTGAAATPFAIKGEVNGSTPLRPGRATPYVVEWSGFRPFNVENLGSDDARAVKQGASLNEQLAPPLSTSTRARPPRTPTTRT